MSDKMDKAERRELKARNKATKLPGVPFLTRISDALNFLDLYIF